MCINAVYEKIVGQGKPPAPHQEQTWESLSRGQPVVLRAPTGSGKTEAIVLPFLMFSGGRLPARLLYALPLRSLANQTVERINEYAQALSKPQSWRVRLQHGQAPESVLFTADAVAATIDQVITSYACTPLILPLRHGNIPAGAVMSSFVVFDEVHLFDPELGLQATRLICERLNCLGIPYAILSATLPDCVVELWQKELGAEIVEASGEFVQRQVTIQWTGRQLDGRAVLQQINQGCNRILVVCNTVDRAVEIYRQVCEHAQQQGYECNLLHSRFLPEDRERKEEWVLQRFGKSASQGTRAILIATQVVEVGLDISADVLLTEVAPVDALIQRAGRVARWGGQGSVYVYDVASPAPYKQDLVNRTKELLERFRNDSSASLNWDTAKKWVNQILNDEYQRILEESNAYEQVVAQLSRAAFEGSRSRAEAAVRDVNTVEVTVHNNLQAIGTDALRLPTIGVHIGVVKGWMKQAKQKKAPVWRIEIDQQGSDARPSVEVVEITGDKDLSIGDRIVFPPFVLQYSSNYGLHLSAGDQVFQPLPGQGRTLPSSAPWKESWVEHSVRTAYAVEEVLAKEWHAVQALARLLDVDDALIRKAATLVALLHDLGKLSIEWQKKAGILHTAGASDLLAHTDGRVYMNFPPHATVSTYALWDALVDEQVFPRILARAMGFAIAHHHSVRAKEVPKYEFHPQWRSAVEQVLQVCNLAGVLDLNRVVKRQNSPTALRDRFPPLEYECLYTAYVLISRWLRLADRLATGGEDALLRYENWFGRL